MIDSKPAKKYNDINYGDGHIIAVDWDKWILPGRDITTNPKRAMLAAVRLNRILGGTPTPAQRIMAGF
jgi:hypothetical protein